MEFEDSFLDYCMVCDRLIEKAKAKEVVKRKPAAGAIRVSAPLFPSIACERRVELIGKIRNADGTVTTRTADGTKTVRPALKGAATTNKSTTGTAQVSPLTRTESEATTPLTATTAPDPASNSSFVSPIYCSKACSDLDATRHAQYDFPLSPTYAITIPYVGAPPRLYPTNVGVRADSTRSPYAPPSPLGMSDTESSMSSNPAPTTAVPPASSAPQARDYFRMGRDDPDRAWRENNEVMARNRRSSMHPAVRPGVPMMPRRASQASQASQSTQPNASSDSLYSLWNDDSLHRSTSNPGRMRGMTPLEGPRRLSNHSDRERPRTLQRSNLSQASLVPSPPASPMFATPVNVPGTTPSALSLLQCYAGNFPPRSSHSVSLVSTSFHHTPTPTPRDAPENVINGYRVGEITWESFHEKQIGLGKPSRSTSSASVSVPSRPPFQHTNTTPKQSLHTSGTIKARSAHRTTSDLVSATERLNVADAGAASSPQRKWGADCQWKDQRFTRFQRG